MISYLMHVFTELNKKLRIRHRVYPESVYGVFIYLILVFLVYYSCTFLLSRTMIFYSSVTKSSSSASSVSITSSVNAVSSFSKLSFTASALTASAFSASAFSPSALSSVSVPLPASLLLWHLYFNATSRYFFHTRTRRNMFTDNYVFFQTDKMIDFSFDCRFGKNFRCFLERCG